MTWRTPCSICSSTCCRLLAIVLATAVAPRAEARTWVVAASHAQADDAGPGTEERPFRTIGSSSSGSTTRRHDLGTSGRVSAASCARTRR